MWLPNKRAAFAVVIVSLLILIPAALAETKTSSTTNQTPSHSVHLASAAASPLSSMHRFARRIQTQRLKKVRWYHARFVARAAAKAKARAEAAQAAAALPADGVLAAIAQCESGGNPAAVDSTGTYRGLYQFDRGTWASVGGTGDPAAASAAEQTQRAGMLYARSGSSPWPVCGR